jgi:hypothetical protein
MKDCVGQYDFDGNLVSPEHPRLAEVTYARLLDEFDSPTAIETALFYPGLLKNMGLILRDRDEDGATEHLIICGVTPKEYLSTTQIVLSHFRDENRYGLATVSLRKGFSRYDGYIPFAHINGDTQENWRKLLLNILHAKPDSDIRKAFGYQTHPTSKVLTLLQRVLRVKLNSSLA